MHSEIPALSFISAALVLVPVTWYLEARNIAGMAIGILLSIVNLILTVDALIWGQDTNIKASVWCDISTSFITGSRIALPAACLCICVHLERLASFCQTSTPLAKRRRILFECIMCFGLPVLYTALHLIVQPRRFDLVYGFGCRPASYPTVATLFLVLIPPLLVTLVTVCFAVLAWRHFVLHGVQFSGKRSSASSLTRNLYVRLVGMALLETTFSALLVAITMWPVLSAGLLPLTDLPRDLSLIVAWGPDAITDALRAALEIEWTGTVIQSVVFFGLFASRMEVLREAWQAVCSFQEFFRRRNVNAWLKRGTSLRSSESVGASVPALPSTVVDLSVAMRSVSTVTRDGHPVPKSLPPTPNPSRPPSLIEDVSQELVMSAIDPAMIPLDSPSRSSAIPSSHNSLESNFDPLQLILPPDELPRLQPLSPVHIGRRRSSSTGYIPKHQSRLDVEASFPESPLHVRSCTSDFCTSMISNGGWDVRQAIYVAIPARSP